MMLIRIAFKCQGNSFKNSYNFVCLGFYVSTLSFHASGIVSVVTEDFPPW